ncbi:MAG: hypothetical protein IT235_05070 [Bacteroidia bacterium]|nr:hypothetical protein [Bacteroidia bacterium]
MRLTLCITLLCFSLLAYTQTSGEKNNTPLNTDTIKKTVVNHSVRKATLLSVVLPGGGQFYNRKYWKPPVIYTAFAIFGYLIKTNNDNYNVFKQAYIYRTDNNAATTDPYVNKYSDDNLLTLKNSYQRSRDFNIICFTAVYILNIVDAAVDAHLYTFDVSENLSIQLQPTFINTAQNNVYGTGISIGLKF